VAGCSFRLDPISLDRPGWPNSTRLGQVVEVVVERGQLLRLDGVDGNFDLQASASWLDSSWPAGRSISLAGVVSVYSISRCLARAEPLPSSSQAELAQLSSRMAELLAFLIFPFPLLGLAAAGLAILADQFRGRW
jgi:hypothetical protein